MMLEEFVKTIIGYKKIEVLGFDSESDMYHEDEGVFVAAVALEKETLCRCPI